MITVLLIQRTVRIDGVAVVTRRWMRGWHLLGV
jgi:hypothetical protein